MKNMDLQPGIGECLPRPRATKDLESDATAKELADLETFPKNG